MHVTKLSDARPVMPLTPNRRPIVDCLTCQHRELRMFCNLGEQALAEFDSIGVEACFPRGALLFEEGGLSRNVLVLCTGQAKLFCVSREGKTLILKIAGSGDVLGLSAVLSGSPYEVTAEVIERSEVKTIRKQDFLRFLERHTEASLHAAKALSQEYKTAFFDARRLALSGSAAGRLARVLLDWGAAVACGKPQMRFTMALTQEELANMIGTSRETVSRLLARFKRENLIAVTGSSIHILSPELLDQVCE